MDGDTFGGFGLPIPPELAKALARLLGSRDPVDSPNPKAYPRWAKIADGDLNLMLSEYERLNEKVDLLRNEVSEVDHMRDALLARVYRRCNEVYREVSRRGDMEAAGCGLRKWKGEFHIVGWNNHKEEEEEKDK